MAPKASSVRTLTLECFADGACITGVDAITGYRLTFALFTCQSGFAGYNELRNMAGAHEFELNAGNRALDFINTLDNTGSPDGSVDLLPDYASLLRFSEATAALCGTEIRALHRIGQKGKDAVAREIPVLRETLRRIFSAVVQGRTVAATDLTELNEHLEGALYHRQLVKHGKTFIWAWVNVETDAASPFWPILLDAAELLVSDRLPLVRECDNETCGWLFLDTSKNHSRRWCDMKTCGNRVKARTYYRRLREAAEAE